MKNATKKRLVVGRETIRTLTLVSAMDRLRLVHGGTSTTTTQQEPSKDPDTSAMVVLD